MSEINTLDSETSGFSDSGGKVVSEDHLVRRPPRPLMAGFAARFGRSRQRVAWFSTAVAAGCIAMGLGFIGLMKLTTPQAVTLPEAIPLSVDVFEVSGTDQFEKTVSFLGRVEAARESELSFERGGLIARMYVDEGDTVEPMQPLAALDIDKLSAERDVLTARLEAAEAMLAELVSGPRDETIEAQEAEVSRLASELKRAELQRDRQAQLLPRAATSKDEYETALYTAEATKSALDAARASLLELENGTRSEQLMTQRAVVKQIKAERNSIDVDIRKSQLLAPFSGTVADRFVDEGRVIAAGQSIISLLEISRPEIRVGVDSETAASLSVGDLLPVTIHGELLQSKIKAIRRDVAGKTRTVDILLTLVRRGADSGPILRSGDLVTVDVHRVIRREGAWIPMGSLTEGGRGLWSVFAIASETSLKETPSHRVERRDVEVLHTTAEQVFVRGAVDDGDQIVASGIHRLVPGQAVKPLIPSRRLASREQE